MNKTFTEEMIDISDLDAFDRILKNCDGGMGYFDARSLQKLSTELRELRAVMERLPTTADGFPVVPEMRVFILYDGEPKEITVEYVGADSIYYSSNYYCTRCCPAKRVFSTREPAEAELRRAIAAAEALGDRQALEAAEAKDAGHA